MNGSDKAIDYLVITSALHPVAYASRALTPAEKNYAITELETLAVVWAITHFHVYLYGHDVTVYTDHTAVKAVLETPSPNGKHARWWTRVYGSGVESVHIVYRAGKENTNADALSRNPVSLPPKEDVHSGAQVAVVDSTDTTIEELLAAPPDSPDRTLDLAEEQRKDREILEIIAFLESGSLPKDEQKARKIVIQEPSFALVDGILYFLDSRHGDRKRVAVPKHLRQGILEENHSGPMAGHFSGERLYKSLLHHWWWPGMYTDTVKHCASCPQCAIVLGSGRVNRPPLHPIPVQRAFPDCRGGCNGSPRDRSREQACSGISGLPDQMAISFPCVRSEGHNPCRAACRTSHSCTWCPGSTLVRPRYEFCYRI